VIFCLICFWGHNSYSMCILFWCHHVAFRDNDRTILVSFFWWLCDVHGRATMNLQRTLFLLLPNIILTTHFFIVNYCQNIFALFIVDIFFIILLNYTSLLNLLKWKTQVLDLSCFFKIISSKYFFSLLNFFSIIVFFIYII